jgi:ATP-dependent Clp protease protease subunit
MKKVEEGLERDNFMSPEEAKDWGLIDEIVENRGKEDDPDDKKKPKKGK